VAPRKKKAGGKRAAARQAPARRGGSTKGRGVRRATSADAYPEVEALVDLMNRHGLIEVDYETGADGVRRIRVSRGGGGALHPPIAALAAHGAPLAHASSGHASGAEPPAASSPSGPDASAGLHPFKSPMVGTFYRAPSPESPPVVSVGDHADATTTGCIIEAMEGLNEIGPDVGGEIVSIEVENGEAVEDGQTLFLIRTA
jgi:acetyl-CoA carboxylase biotin carboxyl carrier protein